MVYYFLLILWVYWKVLLLGVGGLTHMSAFSWAQLEQHCSAVYGGSLIALLFALNSVLVQTINYRITQY